MARLVLVGLPGSGKSTVALELGRALGVTTCDTDDTIAERVGSTVGDYLRAVGEATFRSVELAALLDCVGHDAVVATGGGVVESESARDLLARELTVWLDAPDEVLVGRIAGGDRPLLGGEPAYAIAALRRKRSAWYEAVATARVDATGSVADVSARVRRAMIAT